MVENPKQHPKAEDSRPQLESRPSERQTAETRPEEKTDDKRSGWLHWKIIASGFIGIGGFITVSLLVWQGAEWIRKSIDENVSAKLNDERVLRQIAAQVRPSVLFDANGAITIDMGAAPFIANNGNAIEIAKEADGWPRRIRVGFNRHFANPPILTSMYESTLIIPKRSKGFAWDFEVSDVIQHGTVSSNLWIYRLEIVP